MQINEIGSWKDLWMVN